MKVSINHSETQHGLVFKKTYYAVTVSVTFNEEEMAVIRKRKMEKSVLLERGPDAVVRERFKNKQDYLASLGGFELSVNKLLKGPDSYECETPVAAKQYEAQVIDGLKILKEHLQGNAELAENKSFEL